MSNYIFMTFSGALLPGKMNIFPENVKRKESNYRNVIMDNYGIQCFNLWAKYSDAEIVLSTSWVHKFLDSKIELPDILARNGLKDVNFHKVMFTPKKFSSGRHSEIWWWLLDNASSGDKFLIVDSDQSCAHIKTYLEKRNEDNRVPHITGDWINVDYQNGLTVNDFKMGCNILDIDLEYLYEQEFGIKSVSEEELKQRQKALDLLIGSMI